MTKSDFELIAEVVRFSDLSGDQKKELADQFAAKLSRTNPRFDADRFVTACLSDGIPVPYKRSSPRVSAIPYTPPNYR